MTGWKDGQTLFHRIPLATARGGGLTSATGINWHLKVKDIEYHVGLTENSCITVSMQKISSIHTLILKIQINKWSCPFLSTHTQKSVK